MMPWQAFTYEALAHLGPVWSAVFSGFAVYVWGELHITPAGQRYLSTMES
jgi:hypothetical protein